MTLEEWIELYNDKTDGKFERDERFELYYLPTRGFCEIGQTADMLIINQLCGDARFWKYEVDKLANKLKIKTCGTWCIRSETMAYVRLFGYKIVRTEKLSDGLKRYFAIHKRSGKHGQMSPAFRYADGTQAWFITWEP